MSFRRLKLFGLYLAFLALATFPIAWAGGMIWFAMPWRWLSIAGTALFWAGCGYAFWRFRWHSLKWITGAYTILVVIWLLIPARDDRDWAPELAVTAWAQFDGDQATIHNVRDFDWTGPESGTPRHYDKTYDLKQLKTLDWICSYWAGDAIAHTMISFGFRNGDHLAVSVEIRREKSEQFSTLAGFFKQYELMYVVADERDVLGVRSNFRNERVYVFPTNTTPEQCRRLFRVVMRRVNELHEKPEWYNTLTHNCTTSLVDHLDEVSGTTTPWTKLLLTGHTPKLAYESGWIRSNGVKAEHLITARAKEAQGDPRFSMRIRGQ